MEALLDFISRLQTSVPQISLSAVFPATLYLWKKDSGSKVLVVQEGNCSNIFHQVSFLCLQIHETCGGQVSLLLFMCGAMLKKSVLNNKDEAVFFYQVEV